MKRLFLLAIILIASYSFSYAQNSNSPVKIHENLNKGIYASFHEFLENRPIVTTGYDVKIKPMSNKNWIGSNSYSLKFSSSKNKIKRPWGFSDGSTAYILHQNKFFPIYTDNDKYLFKGFALINQTAIAAMAYAGGLIGGGIASGLEQKRIKDNPTIYSIDKYTGTPIDETIELTNKLGETVDLYLYRKGKKELSQPIMLLVQDDISLSFIPNSYKVFEVRLGKSPIKICYGKDYSSCESIELDPKEDTYVQISNLGEGETVLKVDHSQGEYDIVKPQREQKKREKEALSIENNK